jgi:hypothetical protein
VMLFKVVFGHTGIQGSKAKISCIIYPTENV